MSGRNWTIRAVLFGSVAALLIWLAWSPSSDSKRIAQINSALARGTIGHLDHSDEENLHRTLEWLFAAAGFTGRIVLDQPYSSNGRARGDLQVFVTSPEAHSATLCGPGNAVYDAALDAIFIDKEIVVPDDWKKLLATPDGGWGLDIPLGLEDAPWLRVYLRFVILHELGHRKLHRRAANSFDVNLSGPSVVLRRMENEADEFAIARMNEAYPTADKFGVVAVEKYTGSTINYEVKDSMPVADQVQASLIEMAQAISAGRLALPSATPLFRDDYAHPSYLDRAQGLVRESLKRSDINPDLRLFAQYVENSFDRLQEARKSGIVEITADQPVGGVIFDEKGMIVVLKGTLYRVSYEELHHLVDENRPISLEAASSQTYSQPLRGFRDHGQKLTGFWSSAGIGTVLLWSDGQESIISGDLRSSGIRPAQSEKTVLSFDHVVTGPEPSDDAVATAKDPAGKTWIAAFRKDQLVSSVALEDLNAQCVALGAATGAEADMEFAQLVDGILLSPLVMSSKGHTVIYGYVQISLRDLKPMEVKKVVLPSDMQSRTSSRYNPLLTADAGDREMVFEREGGQTKAILVNVVRYPPTDRLLSGRGVKWQTWELHTDRNPTLLQEQTFLSDYFNQHLSAVQVDNLAITPRLPAGGVHLIPPDKLLVNVDSDSIYLTDTKSHRVVFHPGSDTVSAQVASNGMVAIFVRPGYRIFVLRNIGD